MLPMLLLFLNLFALSLTRSDHLSGISLEQVRIAVIGSGNWGTAVARRIALNAEQIHTTFNQRIVNKTVNMWVFEEVVDGHNLTDIINRDHVNIKYLPGIGLPSGVVALKDVREAVRDADVLLFVVPHQFLEGVLASMKGHTKPGAVGVSLIKGVTFTSSGPELYSQTIRCALSLQHVAVVMGANVAMDVASDAYAETTVAADDLGVAEQVANLFRCSSFHAQVTSDTAGVELCGALKNIVALGAGMCDALGAGDSSKAALLRQGLLEMELFCEVFDKKGSFQRGRTIMLSCGVADVIASSYSGRNRRCAQLFAKRLLDTMMPYSANRGLHAASEEKEHRLQWVSELWDEIERREMNGQKLQGVSTCRDIMRCLQATSYLEAHPSHFPLFRRIYSIACQGEDPRALFHWDI